MIILLVAVVWFFVIVCLRIAGQKRVGFFAGRFVLPEKETLQSFNEVEEKGGVEVVMEKEQAPDDDDNYIKESIPVDETSGAFNEGSVKAHADKKFKRKVFAVRALFIMSGIIVIVSGCLFYGKGVASFKTSLNEVRSGIDVSSSRSSSLSGVINCSLY